MLHDFLLPITHAAGDDVALDAAARLTAQWNGHLTVVEPVHLPLPSVEIPPEFLVGNIYADLRQRGQQNAAQLKSRLEALGVNFEVRVCEGQFAPTWQIVALHARYADLSIIAAPAEGSTGETVRDCIAALLFESGRPLLVVPAHRTITLPIRHVVVAWQPTREAARALHDALPLLRLAKSIDVLTVDPVVSETRHGQDPGVDIAKHLAHHGLNVNVIALPGHGENPARTLLRHASESGAQLLVAGGYGHSRLRHWLLGSTTSELLLHSDVPVLLSH